MNKIAVNWYDEELDKFYKDNNEGLIYGIYYLDNEEQVQDVSWFKTIEERTLYFIVASFIGVAVFISWVVLIFSDYKEGVKNE